MPRILINFAHPAYERSKVNRALIESVQDLDHVRVNDLYEAYPDFMIDVEREQSLLSENDIILFQHPLYWYSSPSILKEWQDLVLTHRWAYGSEGTALAGKQWIQAVSTGAPEEVYCCEGENRFTIAEFLRPFEATAQLCSMEWKRPYVVYGVHALGDQEVRSVAAEYRTFVANLK